MLWSVVDALEQRLDDIVYVTFLGKIKLLAASGHLFGRGIWINLTALFSLNISFCRNGVSHGIKAVLFAHLLVNEDLRIHNLTRKVL